MIKNPEIASAAAVKAQFIKWQNAHEKMIAIYKDNKLSYYLLDNIRQGKDIKNMKLYARGGPKLASDKDELVVKLKAAAAEYNAEGEKLAKLTKRKLADLVVLRDMPLAWQKYILYKLKLPPAPSNKLADYVSHMLAQPRKLVDPMIKQFNATGVKAPVRSLRAKLIQQALAYEAKLDKKVTEKANDMMSIRNQIKKQLETAAKKITVKVNESASVEVAKASTKKMAAKIAAIAQNMQLSVKQWDNIDKEVRKLAFGGKEKAASRPEPKPKNNSAKNILMRIKSGKVNLAESTLNSDLSESKVKADMKMSKNEGNDEDAVMTVKGDSPNHFWVVYKDNKNDYIGAVYEHEGEWLGFMGNLPECIGKYSNKDIAAWAVMMDANS